MSLRESSGRWHWRFQYHGREYTGSSGLKATPENRPKAEAREAKARAVVEAGLCDSLRIKTRRFDDAAKDWLAWQQGECRAESTFVRLRSSANVLVAFFGNLPLSQLTAGRIDDFKAWRRAQNVKEVSIRHDLHALSPMLAYCRKQRWLSGNPLEDVAIPSDADAVRMHPLTPAEEQAYFAACQSRKAFDLYDLGRLMIQQGCRPEEFLSLRWDAVDLEAGTFHIVRSKTRAGRRTLRMTQETREILARRLRYQESHPSEFVFASPKLHGRHRYPMQDAHELVLAACGLSFVMYDWRHTFGTRKALQGMPLPTLAAIMGHANLRSIQKYVHVGTDDMAAAMAKYDDSLPMVAESDALAGGMVQ